MWKKITRTAAVYLGSSWVLIEAFSYFIDRYSYPHYYVDLLIILLVFGLASFILNSWYSNSEKSGFTYLVYVFHLVNFVIASSAVYYYHVEKQKQEIRHTKGTIDAVSIAILPFEDLSPQPGNEWLGDMICSRMIDHLDMINSFDVKSKSSSFYFKDKDFNLVQIANLMSVNTLVEGSILVIDSILQVSVKLVKPLTGTQIWSETFERPLNNLMHLQAEIALIVSKKVGLQLTQLQKHKVEKPLTKNSKAYEAYMRGRYHYNLLTVVDNKRANDYFLEAVRLDPEFAEAYAFLGMTYGLFGGYWLGLSPDSAYEKVKDLYEKALSIDKQLPMGQFLKANYIYFHKRDYSEGLNISRTAFELSESKDQMIWMHCMMLGINKQVEESLDILYSYVDQNPTSAQALQGLCQAELMKYGRVTSVPADSIINTCEKAMSLDPSLIYNKYYIAELHFIRKNYTAARSYFQELYDMAPTVHFTEGLFRTNYYLEEKQLATLYLNQLRRHNKKYSIPYRMAMAHATMKNIDSVSFYLDKAFAISDNELVALWNEPGFDPVRGEERFRNQLSRLEYDGSSKTDPNFGQLLFSNSEYSE